MPRQVEINGHVFTFLKPDSEILHKVVEFYNRDRDAASEEIEAAIKAREDLQHDMQSYIDEMLGDGAFYKITNGISLDLEATYEVIFKIAVSIYDDRDNYRLRENWKESRKNRR